MQIILLLSWRQTSNWNCLRLHLEKSYLPFSYTKSCYCCFCARFGEIKNIRRKTNISYGIPEILFFLRELFQCESCTYIYVSYVSRYLATNWIYLFVQWTLETWYINISPHILSLAFHVVGIFIFKHHFIGIRTVCWVIQLLIYLALILIYNTLERYIFYY